jgi:hypothetical protein
MLRIIGESGASKVAKANQKSADEFMALVRMGCPQDDDAGGHLVETLKQEKSGEVGVAVSIGDEHGGRFAYPAHLEFGHKLPNGSHVAPKPFWFPAKRIAKKRAHDRNSRAYRAAIKAAVGNATTVPEG